MSLANKIFKNNLTGETHRVIDTFEHIAILENREKINVNTLMNPNLYTEEIDPSTFFQTQNSYDSLASKIRNIDTTYLSDDENGAEVKISGSNNSFNVSNESAIIMADEIDERAALAAKYGASIDNHSSISKQNEAFAEILGDDSELPEVPAPRTYQNYTEQPEFQRIDINRDTPTKQLSEMRYEEDPIIKMFKGVKRSVDFNISLDVKGKIPRLDFIEMMEDSYEKSIIDFLADEFTKNILSDPDELKSRIKSTLMEMVYSDSGSIKSDKKAKVNEVKEEKVEETKDEVVDKPKRKYRKKNDTTE